MNDLLDSVPPGKHSKLPNATTVLVLGIVSIVGSSVVAGIPGLICGILGLVIFQRDKEIYLSDVDQYKESFKLSNAGFICSIVGTSLSGLSALRLLDFF